MNKEWQTSFVVVRWFEKKAIAPLFYMRAERRVDICMSFGGRKEKSEMVLGGGRWEVMILGGGLSAFLRYFQRTGYKYLCTTYGKVIGMEGESEPGQALRSSDLFRPDRV